MTASDHPSVTDVHALVAELLDAPRDALSLGSYTGADAERLASALGAGDALRPARRYLRFKLECVAQGLVEVGSVAFVARFGRHTPESLGSDAFQGLPVAVMVRDPGAPAGHRIVRGRHGGSDDGRLSARIETPTGEVKVLVLDVQTFFAGGPDDTPMAERTRAAISAMVGRGEPTLEAIARVLRVGRRTLQRRLSEEDTTFAQVLDQVRADIARVAVLDDNVSYAELSDRLGFSRESAFFRAFKRWTGLTPTEFKKQR